MTKEIKMTEAQRAQTYDAFMRWMSAIGDQPLTAFIRDNPKYLSDTLSDTRLTFGQFLQMAEEITKHGEDYLLQREDLAVIEKLYTYVTDFLKWGSAPERESYLFANVLLFSSFQTLKSVFETNFGMSLDRIGKEKE